MMAISQCGYNVNHNLLSLPNVQLAIDKKPLNMKDYSYQTNLAIYEVLFPLKDKPWTFVPQHTRGLSKTEDGKDVRIITDFFIYEGNECLGSVGVTYVGRSYKIYVENDRVSAGRKSGRSYRTEDVKKATMMIRKNFYRMPDAEKVEKLGTAAVNSLMTANWNVVGELQKAKKKFFDKAEDFILANMDLYVGQFPSALTARNIVDKHNLDHSTFKFVCDLHESRKTIFIIKEDTHYIVKVGDTISTSTDEDLSEDIRRKLGMLKLVDEGQCIEGMGFRASDTTFIITPEVAQ